MDLARWWGVFVPAGTPQPIKDRLAAWTGKINAMDETKVFLRDCYDHTV